MISNHICSPLDPVTQTLEIRHATEKFEIDQLRAALNDEHYLNAGRPAGNTIWQGIYQTDGDEGYPVLCAVLCWSGAVPRLKDRDEWIGWDPLTRGSRLPLVSQLRRFLVLESRREPNLATRCMGLALRELPGHFEEKYGYRPLLAESFSDPQLHEGTIYKASNWTPLGFSKGFARHKSEFYIDEKKPKKYWIYPLHKNSRQLLSSPSPLPEIFQKGTCEGVAGARCALPCKHLRSLSDAFYNIPDHRSPMSRRYSKIGMFGLIAHGLLVGAPTVKAIWKRCGALGQGQRKAIGLNVRNEKGRLVMPSYDALNNFINGIDPSALAKALNQWLAAHQDKLPKSLALDGKDLGHALGAIVTLCRHEDGRPVAMASYSGKKDDCELPVAQELLKQSGSMLENATITADALHTQKKTNCLINELGGESFSAIKKNQGSYYKYAEQLLADRPVDLVGELERGHGRFEIRDITLVAVDTEVSPFPHIAQIVKCTRIYRSTKAGAEPEISVRLFGTSHEYGSKTAAQISKLIREHWSVENLNHWKRDASYWREDRAPKRNPNGAKNLAMLRNALLAVIPFERFDSLNDAFDYYRDHREKSVQIINSASPCQN